jgi:hypothetical protein
MNARTHDEARVVSAQFQLPLSSGGDMSRLLELLTGGMRAINHWAEANDVIIGHVKGYVSWGEEAVMVSTTGEEVQVKGSQAYPGESFTADVGIASIVFGVGLDELEEIIELFVGDILKSFEFAFTIAHASEHHHHEHGEECGCGEHEHHHHEHGGECGCGEHEHHHHEHGDGCTCGEHENHS